MIFSVYTILRVIKRAILCYHNKKPVSVSSCDDLVTILSLETGRLFKMSTLEITKTNSSDLTGHTVGFFEHRFY